jgi:hypothetical protein
MGGHRVCVTGASGFVASHIAEALLALGHDVRGTVRKPQEPERYRHLTELDREGRLELVGGDLIVEGSYDDAVQGCDVLMHTASPYVITVDDAQRVRLEHALQPHPEPVLLLEDGGRKGSLGLRRARNATLGLGGHKPLPGDRPLPRALAEHLEWRDPLSPDGRISRHSLGELGNRRRAGRGHRPCGWHGTTPGLGPAPHRRLCPRYAGAGRDYPEHEVGLQAAELAPGRERGHVHGAHRGPLPGGRDPRLPAHQPGQAGGFDNSKVRDELELSFLPLEETLRDTVTDLVRHGHLAR